jgi:hypothetical protein
MLVIQLLAIHWNAGHSAVNLLTFCLLFYCKPKYEILIFIFLYGAPPHLGPRPPSLLKLLGLSRSLSLSLARARARAHTHTPLGLLWTRDQPVTEAAAYTTSKKHNRQTSVPSAGSEPVIPAIEQPHTYVLDHTATWIGKCEMRA